MVIFKFSPESDTRTLAEILKIDQFQCLPSFPVKLWKSVKMIKFEYKHDSEAVSWWIGTELRSFSHFQILTKIAYPDLSRKLENWLFLEFFFIHCKTVKVSQNDQIQMQTWFTSGFLMNGTELRSFSHFQILTWIGYSDLSRNLENWLILMFPFIPCETVKVSQDDQIRI